MILEKLPKEFSSQSEKMDPDTNSNRSDDHGQLYQDDTFFIARVRPLKNLKFDSPHPKETANVLVISHSL